MSRCVVQRIDCPSCGARQDEKVFVSVNGARIKSAADRIIDGTWGEVSCLACGHRYLAEAPVLYSDLADGVWIVRHPLERRGEFERLEAEAEAIFVREFIERPPAAIRAKALRVRRRICFGREQLAEKLLARREGIDDLALECLKLVLSREHIDALFPLGPWEWRLESADDKTIGLKAVAIAGRRPVFQTFIPRERLMLVAGDLSPYREAFPELFGKIYVNASRYLTDRAAA
ncbi:MAG: CpXC domain-containing protein [Alphaproteobacteria bacterium]